jgi:hypothetical protein
MAMQVWLSEKILVQYKPKSNSYGGMAGVRA